MSDCLVINSSGQPLSLVPLSTVSWQVALRLYFTDKVKIIKEHDNWVVRSQHLEMNVPSIVIMTEQAKWDRSLKYNRHNVFVRDEFTCQLQITNKCKNRNGKTTVDNLTLDHVLPRSLGGKTTWTNVCTCCKDCNGKKGNDKTILPKKLPKKPTYYELLAKRKNRPLFIKDIAWNDYISWPEDLVTVTPHKSE